MRRSGSRIFLRHENDAPLPDCRRPHRSVRSISFSKSEHIQARNKGGGVVFATGTPISNYEAEMFTMQRYLQMDTLRRRFAPAFRIHGREHSAKTVTSMELSPGRKRVSSAKPFRAILNVPELMQQFRQVADVQTGEMLKLPVPSLSKAEQ